MKLRLRSCPGVLLQKQDAMALVCHEEVPGPTAMVASVVSEIFSSSERGESAVKT